ncbi:hypothetical protein CYY_004453 [Polysphondylium violaceum]|uniref:Cytochrome P450 family protein n=1 Tax=Polysphondylium violaceum TaxID=133409 RepID=A0A8J4PUL0_9MYCE|nr:hypothetical protein CYY_004453 [Polysphondylium violaceum]
MEIITTLLLTIAVILFCSIYFKNKKRDDYPPGPFNLPFLGALYLIKQNQAHLGLHKLYKKYGKIFSMKFGDVDTIVISEPSIILEMFHNQGAKFYDRFITPSFEIVGGYRKNIGFTNGPHWKKIRGIVNASLTKSKTRQLEDLINFQFDKMHDSLELELKKTDIINMKTFFKKLTFNVIFNYCFGGFVPYEDESIPEDVKIFVLNSERLLSHLAAGKASDYIHCLKPFSSYQELHNIMDGIMSFIKPNVEYHIKTLDENKPRDFIDNLIIEIKNDPAKTIDVSCIQNICVDLLVGGTDTTATTLQWMILYLSNNPHYQEKLFQEIKSISPDGFPSLSDRGKFTFFNAVLKETFRRSPIVPLGLSHMVAEDAQVEQYFLPKGTQVLANFYSASLDESIWEEPLVFNPMRHFNSQSPVLVFSVGPRKCPGQNLSEDELFLIGTKIFKLFKFSRPSEELFDESPVMGVTLEAKFFNSKIELR